MRGNSLLNYMKYPIDLGRKMDNGLIAAPQSLDTSEKHYPSLFLEWDDDYELPKSGTMIVTFEKSSETNSETNGKTRQTVTLDIKEIKSVVGESKDEGDEECTDCALDRLKDEADKKSATKY